MAHQLLQGFKEIASHLGVQTHGVDARRLLTSWIRREGLPARRLAGRWYADTGELDAWWQSRNGPPAR
jgi:hypothetical protein